MPRSSDRPFNFEERTKLFAIEVRRFVKRLPTTVANREDIKQLVRSSGSIGANYIEANDSLGKKDFLMRLRIARKESKETRYWLDLVDCGSDRTVGEEQARLHLEAGELLCILSAMIAKRENSDR